MDKIHNIFACLVHENRECVIDLVRNLRALDPASAVLLYNGSSDPDLLKSRLSFARYGADLHPWPRPLAWGRLHDFALDCMEFALETTQFDTLTVVDSDQLGIRPGYSDYLAAILDGRSGLGMLVNSPEVQSLYTRVGPAMAAYQEIDLWRPFLHRFPDGERKFVHWSFWPSTVFTAEAARDLVDLFRNDRQLREIMEQTRIWASEEVVLPTLAALLGYEIAPNPCSYDYVRYRMPYSLTEADVALSRPDVFWIHPVPRRYEDPLRVHLRLRLDQHLSTMPKGATMPTDHTPEPPLLLTWPILARMRAIEGWLDDEEADLLIAAVLRAVSAPQAARAIVEVGSYCGRSTVVLGSVLQSLRLLDARVYAIDPHDGRVGALDQGIEQLPPSLDKFQRNIATAGLEGFVEPIRSNSFEVHWDKPICFLFIDGLHDYMNVARDFYHFEPWVAVGGYIAFHDYADYYPGVVTFVDEILGGGGYERTHCAASLIVLRKSGATVRSEAGRAEPLVSCIMPTADRRAFVPLAIRYFLRQDYENRELIILDDGSDPVSDLIPKDPRIRYIRMQERRTMGAKHNQGCLLARGEIIAHWDDDDWFAERRLSYQVSELLKQPRMTLTGFSRVLFYCPNADRAWEYIYPPAQLPWVCGSTFCYRKEFWERHPFPDMNEGADTVFVWGLNGDARVLALSDNRCLVGMVHQRNTSPKRTDDAGWHPLPAEEIYDLLGTDISFYREVAIALA
jgi:predicted O-methyltransferase YrrM